MKLSILIFFCVGILSALGFVNYYGHGPGADEAFSRKANLALRQVGHQLLQLAGDSSSAIPPVWMNGSGSFTLALGASFNYDTLPHLIGEALRAYNIQRDYEVVVKRCNDDLPILGYNRAAFAGGEVPCIGREQLTGCNNIIVAFTNTSAPLAGMPVNRFSLLLLALLAITGIAFFWKRNRKTAAASSSGSTIPLGNFHFDHYNQTLQLGDRQQQLTFRESKLLNFLASHANEVVTRERLLAAVWEDEGVIVSRSLDVFISRLRKLLKEDESVAITTIRSVGYRLEVAER